MATGFTRRGGATDNLAGAADMQPVTLQGPGISSPAPIRAPDTSVASRIAGKLNEWSGGQLQAAANKQHERDLLDGQMAHQQGKTFEQVQMGGNKWALEGYRLMDAQTISSTLLSAQMKKIGEGDRELSQDQFRETFLNRIDQMLVGTDDRTASLVKEQMMSQMPTLVEAHTTQHLTWQEGQNFDSLERSIDVISRDPTATDQLVLFARGGEDSPSAGLTDARRQAATVSGVIRAFDNDNPLAFSALSKEGLLGDNLSTDEKNSIRAAQQRFENRRRTEYNEALFNGEQAIMAKIEAGQLSPQKAVEEISVLYAEYGITMNKADAGVFYGSAQETERADRITRGNLIDEAGLRGDVDTQANIILDSLTATESSGNSSAYRTNADGRSFGGLIQMGQARLNEIMDSMGRAHITVSQYAAMSPAEQRSIGRQHVKQLIAVANATGAIGTKINGVTVTMSGLVAVGHLGGVGGMQKFVSSGGAYNPSDELGTSLTDYLSKHGSGEMSEFMSPQQRLQSAQDKLTETRKRLAMQVYDQVAPRIAELDDQFARGELDKQAWREGRAAVYQEYDYARTKADTDHEIAMIRSVDKSVADAAKSTMQAEYKVALDSAQGALSVHKAAWEEVINNPASDATTITKANTLYREQRSAVYDQYGITAVDRKDGAFTDGMVNATRQAIDRNTTWTAEQAEIDAAMQLGYLGQLPKNLQQRAFKQAEDQIGAQYSAAVQAGKMDADTANAALSADMNAFYAQAGIVDPKIGRAVSAGVMGEMLDKDGNPNPMVVDAVQQYAEVKAMNPRAADTMLSPEAMQRAEAVLSRTTDPSLMGDAVRNLGLELKNSPLIQNPDEYLAQPYVQDRIEKEVKNFLETQDVGWWQGMWQTDAMRDQWHDRSGKQVGAMWSADAKNNLTVEMAEEVTRLHAINPNIKPRDLVARAAENMQRRTEVIGGDIVTLPPGGDFRKAFFGSRANEFAHDSDVNSAVMEYLRSDAAQEQYGFLSGSTGAERLPGWVQGVANFAVGMVPFTDMEFSPAMSTRNAYSTWKTGVRPFRSFLTPGGEIAVSVLKPDGNYSDEIIIPAKQAGEMYMARRRRENAQ